MLLFRLTFIILALSACSRLQNHINYVRLVCGSELSAEDPEFALFRVRYSSGELVDLSSESYEIFNEDFMPISNDQYRSTRSGCLQIKKQDKVFLRLPLKGEASATLVNQKLLNELQLTQDKNPPTITLPVTRSNFRTGETIKVEVNETSRMRYCVDAPGQDLCALKDGARLAFESESFQDFKGTIPLPKAEGSYRLSIVAEDRNGLPGVLLQNFTVDSTIPVVDVDFAQVAESFLFDGKAHFYLDQGYRLGFRSKSEPLNQLTIEYCLVPSSQPEADSCAPESIRVFGAENPEALPAGVWTLIYRATDLSGNRADGWDRLRILAKSSCSEQELLKALDKPEPLTCTELVGDLSVNRIAVEKYEVLRSLIAVSGKISLVESDREALPVFPNLRRLRKLEIRDNYELKEIDMLPVLSTVEDIDISDNDGVQKISGFHELTSLRDLTIASADEAQEVSAFRSLRVIEGKLSLSYLNNLESLSFLESIEKIHSVSLYNLDSFSSLVSLKTCFIQDSIELMYLSALKDFDGLEGATSIEKLHVLSTGITSMKGLEKLVSVKSDLIIEDNPELKELNDLPSLRSVKFITVKRNSGLETIHWQGGLEGLRGLTLDGNSVLASVRGFDSLTDAGFLVVEGNSELKEISGWSRAVQVSYVIIKGNEVLESIDFAPDLKELKTSIEIQNNTQLKRIRGFGNLNKRTGLDIVVKANLEASQNALSSYTSPQED
jgi:hypothetical protein